MKIDKEQFNKLKQLDRIEYRQKYGRIEEEYSSSDSFGVINFFLLLGIIVFFTGIIFDKIEISVSFILFIIFIIGFILIVEIVSRLIYLIKEIKSKNELNEEYFSVEIKK